MNGFQSAILFSIIFASCKSGKNDDPDVEPTIETSPLPNCLEQPAPEYNHPNSIVSCILGNCGKVSVSCALKDGGKLKVLKDNPEQSQTTYTVDIKCLYTAPSYSSDALVFLVAGDVSTKVPVVCMSGSEFVTYKASGNADLVIDTTGLSKLGTIVGTIILEVGNIASEST